MPASLLGLRGTVHNVAAIRYFQADVTFWVDPRTGVLIDQDERGRSVLRGSDGRGELVAADFDLKMSASSRRQLAALADKNAASIADVRVIAPLGGGLLGLLFILAGTIPFRRRRTRTGSGAADAPTEGLGSAEP